jgi:hypothetical protein
MGTMISEWLTCRTPRSCGLFAQDGVRRFAGITAGRSASCPSRKCLVPFVAGSQTAPRYLRAFRVDRYALMMHTHAYEDYTQHR